MSQVKPLARFRVYIWKSSFYFIVYVWRTKKGMLDRRVQLRLPRLTDCQAHVFTYDVWSVRKGHPDQKRPILGEIHFHRKRLGTEVITHESLHATAHTMRRLRFDFARMNDTEIDSRTLTNKDEGEELVAMVQGKLARAIVERLYSLKLMSNVNAQSVVDKTHGR